MSLNAKNFFLVFATVFFAGTFVFAAKPDPGGLGSFALSLPSESQPTITRRVTANIPTDFYPTNRWFGSAYTSFPGRVHNYTMRMSAYPWIINFNTNPTGTASGSGYLFGPAHIMPTPGRPTWTTSTFSPVFRLTGLKSGTAEINSSQTVMDAYSDWCTTLLCQDSADPTKWIKTTVGKGFIFKYNYFSENLNPRIQASGEGTIEFYNSIGTQIASASTFTDERIMVKLYDANKIIYMGVYAPDGDTTFNLTNLTIADITFSSNAVNDADRYLSLAFLAEYDPGSDNFTEAKSIFDEYYNYAYTFIDATTVDYSFNQNNGRLTTDFNFNFVQKRGDLPNIGSVFAVFPHQWKNMPDMGTQELRTLRGQMKVIKGATSIRTVNQFKGIIPNLPFEISDEASKNILQNYADAEYASLNLIYTPPTDSSSDEPANNTYVVGKALARAANLVPIFHQLGGAANVIKRNDIIAKIKKELETWYNYSSVSPHNEKYFGWDSNWGGIIGHPTSFGAQNYNDHHFHYGYFIYASAIVSLFDQDFASAAQYRGMVELLIKNIYNPPSNKPDHNPNFPVLRNFDPYEGHSWSDGAGGADDRGTNQEASPEAMNAWAGIYLWGLATNNQSLMDLGIYGYTTEYAAIKEYYLDKSGQIYAGTSYAYKGVGILYDNESAFTVFWNSADPREILGIQVLPLTPSMLYLGYDSQYAQDYDTSVPDSSTWRDIWLRFRALYNAAAALTAFTSGGFLPESGSSMTFSYHFIKFFDSLGKVAAFKNSGTDYYADNSSFCVMDKSGEKTYIAFNNSTAAFQTVNFYSKAGGIVMSNVKVPPMTMVSAKSYANLKYDSLRAMYSNGNNYALLMDVYSDSITVAAQTQPSIDPVYYETIPFSFTVNTPAGGLNNVTSYVQLTDVNISTYSANQIKLAVYNSQTSLPDKIYPVQNITVASESGGIATVNIEAILTATGTYVLVIPTNIQPPDGIISGFVTFSGRGMNKIKIDVYEYDISTLTGSTKTVTTEANGQYTADIYYGRNYTVTPVSNEYDFMPASLSYNNVPASVSNADFSAQIAAGRFVVYPNPYKPSRHGNAGVTFTNLKQGAEIKIYNIAGELVFNRKIPSDGSFTWHAENNSGYQAASGVYIYHIKSGGKTHKGKLAVER